MEKGSQCVGMNEWRIDTVAIPPIVDRSSAVKLFIGKKKFRLFWVESVKGKTNCEFWISGRGFKRVATLARNWKKNVVEKMKVRGESD